MALGFLQDIYDGLIPDTQIPPGTRNELYRKRRVRLEITTSQINNGVVAAKQDIIELAEVTSVRINSTGNTAIGLATVAAVLQPWYFGPFKVEIAGRSYMGAFANARMNVGVDNDIAKLLDARKNINATFARGDVTHLKTTLIVFDTNDTSNPGVSQLFEGFLDDISVSETESTPFMRDYALKFTGQLGDIEHVLDGADGQKRDDRGLKDRVLGKISQIPFVGKYVGGF